MNLTWNGAPCWFGKILPARRQSTAVVSGACWKMKVSGFLDPDIPCVVLGRYLCWKSTRRLVIDLRIRTNAWLKFSGRAPLAAARSRSRWVLVEGCPVLSVHLAFGLAPHMGQRTDKICRSVSFPGFIPVLFDIANLTRDQSCSRNFTWLRNGNLPVRGLHSPGAQGG